MIIRLGFHCGSHGWYRRGGVSGILVVVMMMVIVITIVIVVTMIIVTITIEWL